MPSVELSSKAPRTDFEVRKARISAGTPRRAIFWGGKAHAELREAGPVQPEGGAAGRRKPPGKVIGHVAGRAHEDFLDSWKGLDEGAGSASRSAPRTTGTSGVCQ
jgi:hypothetical protein